MFPVHLPLVKFFWWRCSWRCIYVKMHSCVRCVAGRTYCCWLNYRDWWRCIFSGGDVWILFEMYCSWSRRIGSGEMYCLSSRCMDLVGDVLRCLGSGRDVLLQFEMYGSSSRCIVPGTVELVLVEMYCSCSRCMDLFEMHCSWSRCIGYGDIFLLFQMDSCGDRLPSDYCSCSRCIPLRGIVAVRQKGGDIFLL